MSARGSDLDLMLARVPNFESPIRPRAVRPTRPSRPAHADHASRPGPMTFRWFAQYYRFLGCFGCRWAGRPWRTPSINLLEGVHAEILLSELRVCV